MILSGTVSYYEVNEAYKKLQEKNNEQRKTIGRQRTEDTQSSNPRCSNEDCGVTEQGFVLNSPEGQT